MLQLKELSFAVRGHTADARYRIFVGVLATGARCGGGLARPPSAEAPDCYAAQEFQETWDSSFLRDAHSALLSMRGVTSMRRGMRRKTLAAVQGAPLRER